ncbi:MAG: hypothetical protein PHS14_14255, partial [Elusimicrobia bacterium]|nr:hypothetical protein [Elusimicrobiota bacterium]
KAFGEGMGVHVVAEGSGKLEATAQVHTGKCVLKGVLLYTDGTNDATLAVYDGTDATGKLLREVHAKGSDGKGPFGDTSVMLRCQTGIWATVTGTGAYFLIDYVKRG